VPTLVKSTRNRTTRHAGKLGYGDLGCYGQQLIQTPNLDRTASEGIRITQFYAGSTMCAPSRSVLMTGKHMGHTRVAWRKQDPRARLQGRSLRDGTVWEMGPTCCELSRDRTGDSRR
jgi:uncharacterized sulfatase